MTDNIMYYPAIVLMVVEAVAFIFLVWSWFDAKRRAEEQKVERCPMCNKPLDWGTEDGN